MEQSPSEQDPNRRYLEIYLRDHYAGAAAGLSLTRRSKAANGDRPLGTLLGEIEAEIEHDRQALESIMQRLGVAPSRLKAATGKVGEVVGRLKSNGHVTTYSPLSRLVELEVLAAGIFTKRNLWRSLRAVADRYEALDAAELERLIAGAEHQLERVRHAHDEAAAEALAEAGSITPPAATSV
jgi:hypothetical protein